MATTAASKLSTADIFNKIRPLMCDLRSPLGQSSGFLLKTDGRMVVVTVAHNVHFNKPVALIFHDHLEEGFEASAIESINPVNAKILDLYAFKTDLPVIDTLEILPPDIPLYEGMKVFFAGYPLGHEKITFHKGLISTIKVNQYITEFTIDGTVVPGNSGGPVVALHENKPYLIGVITSELADFTPEDLKIIKILKALKEQKESQAIPTSLGLGSIVVNQHGTTTSVPIINEKGDLEAVAVNDRDTAILALDLIQRNLSTGIGKAVDIRGFQYLTNEAPLRADTSVYFFPTGRKKLQTSGTIKNTDNKKLLAYAEVEYAAGAGARGIKITMSDGSGTFQYRFDENPHFYTKQYNNNRGALYLNAAQAASLLTPGIQTFTFEAYKKPFTARLQP